LATFAEQDKASGRAADRAAENTQKKKHLTHFTGDTTQVDALPEHTNPDLGATFGECGAKPGSRKIHGDSSARTTTLEAVRLRRPLRND